MFVAKNILSKALNRIAHSLVLDAIHMRISYWAVAHAKAPIKEFVSEWDWMRYQAIKNYMEHGNYQVVYQLKLTL